eukprot:SAG31_NODE_916_length_11047_cov_3.507033_2_plen_295_part_00
MGHNLADTSRCPATARSCHSLGSLRTRSCAHGKLRLSAGHQRVKARRLRSISSREVALLRTHPTLDALASFAATRVNESLANAARHLSTRKVSAALEDPGRCQNVAVWTTKALANVRTESRWRAKLRHARSPKQGFHFRVASAGYSKVIWLLENDTARKQAFPKQYLGTACLNVEVRRRIPAREFYAPCATARLRQRAVQRAALDLHVVGLGGFDDGSQVALDHVGDVGQLVRAVGSRVVAKPRVEGVGRSAGLVAVPQTREVRALLRDVGAVVHVHVAPAEVFRDIVRCFEVF